MVKAAVCSDLTASELSIFSHSDSTALFACKGESDEPLLLSFLDMKEPYCTKSHSCVLTYKVRRECGGILASR